MGKDRKLGSISGMSGGLMKLECDGEMPWHQEDSCCPYIGLGIYRYWHQEGKIQALAYIGLGTRRPTQVSNRGLTHVEASTFSITHHGVPLLLGDTMGKRLQQTNDAKRWE